jgi:hypothetical protein
MSAWGNLKLVVPSRQNRFQRTLDPQTFGMRIAHGSFQRVVSHHQLDGSWSDPIVHAVRGVSIAEFVGLHGDAGFSSGLLHRLSKARF